MKTLVRSKISDWIAFLLIGMSIFGCKTASDHVRLSEKHKQKAIAKGAIYKDSIKTVKIMIPEVINGDTVYLERSVKIPCPEVTVPKTNSQTRQEERTKRTEIKEENKTERNNKAEETKQEKNEQKHEEKKTKIENKCSMFWTVIGKLCWLWGLIGLILGVILTLKFRR